MAKNSSEKGWEGGGADTTTLSLDVDVDVDDDVGTVGREKKAKGSDSRFSWG